MLISFSIENWQSFRDQTTLSMVANQSIKLHQKRIANIKKYRMKILPVAAIYGGNASGKTKFFNALVFAKKFVTDVTQPGNSIPREHFKLDKECANQPTKFSFELLINNICYEYNFAVTQSEVIEEKLIEILPTHERVLYHRRFGTKIDFPEVDKLKNDGRLKFVAEGVRENQLFLTATSDQKITYFQHIYDWFKHGLVLISPTTSFAGIMGENFYSLMNNTLLRLDTGISRLDKKDIPNESLFINKEFKLNLSENLPEGSVALFQDRPIGKGLFFAKNNGILSAGRLISYHKSFDGEEIPFELAQESNGTLRIMELLPALEDLCLNNENPKVYFIDELDQSLHTMLTQIFLTEYLQHYSPDKRSQLLFTTHDALLIDKELMRTDEIWIAERDRRGCSSLTSFNEYKDSKSDKNLRKSYLKGRFGGLPNLDFGSLFDNNKI